MSDEEWSTQEIVRTLRRMASSQERLEEKLDAYTATFITKELHAEQMVAAGKEHAALAKWVTDIAASLERSNKERADEVLSATKNRAEDGEQITSELQTIKDRMLPRSWVIAGFSVLTGLILAVTAIAALFLHH